jgi:hypothetical protein
MRGGAEQLEEEAPALAAMLHQAHQVEQGWTEEDFDADVAQQEDLQWNQNDIHAPAAADVGQEVDEQPLNGAPAPEPHHPNAPPPPPLGGLGNANAVLEDDERGTRHGNAAYLRQHANDPVVAGGRGSVMQVIMCMLTILAEKNVPHVVFDMFMRAVEAALPEGNNWPKYVSFLVTSGLKWCTFLLMA